MLAGPVTHQPFSAGDRPRVSPRRNASLVVALGVASLAVMAATRELLVESFGRPVPERLDPPYPGLRSRRSSRSTRRSGSAPSRPPTAPGHPRAPRHRAKSPPPGRGAAPRRPARLARPDAACPDRRHHREGSGEDEVGHWPGERERWRDGEERRPAWNGDRSRPRSERLFSDLEVTDQPR